MMKMRQTCGAQSASQIPLTKINGIDTASSINYAANGRSWSRPPGPPGGFRVPGKTVPLGCVRGPTFLRAGEGKSWAIRAGGATEQVSFRPCPFGHAVESRTAKSTVDPDTPFLVWNPGPRKVGVWNPGIFSADGNQDFDWAYAGVNLAARRRTNHGAAR